MALKLLELIGQGDDELTGDLGVTGLLMKKGTQYINQWQLSVGFFMVVIIINNNNTYTGEMF